MSIQLSLFWQAADQIDWYWAADTDVYSGTLEELQEQKQQRNIESCATRLFLPASWFSTIELELPANTRRLNPTMVKFAAEEYLAQDIDTVHLVAHQNKATGVSSVEVTDLDRFRQIVQTLSSRDFLIFEAFNCQPFMLTGDQTEDVLLQINEDSVIVSANEQTFNVHGKGFSQWFEIWANQQELEDDVSIRVVSTQADGIAKTIVTELEASGAEVQWLVQEHKQLLDWHDQADSTKAKSNLMIGEFHQGSGETHLNLWLPGLIASVAALVVWSVLTVFQTNQVNDQVNQTWQASENVFKQVFGQSKRIQRPLMMREMRSLVGDSQAADSANVNALSVLADISSADSNLILEDFRFNLERLESFFTIVKVQDGSGDAFNLFEALKADLISRGYAAEYSANQDNDAYRARFKAVHGGQS